MRSPMEGQHPHSTRTQKLSPCLKQTKNNVGAEGEGWDNTPTNSSRIIKCSNDSICIYKGPEWFGLSHVLSHQIEWKQGQILISDHSTCGMSLTGVPLFEILGWHFGYS